MLTNIGLSVVVVVVMKMIMMMMMKVLEMMEEMKLCLCLVVIERDFEGSLVKDQRKKLSLSLSLIQDEKSVDCVRWNEIEQKVDVD